VSEAAAASGDIGKVKLDMISRYLGLVVVPGKYIVKIEVEEFVSQMRGRQQGKGLGAVGIGAGKGGLGGVVA
jgi:hypothetical protein